MLLSTDGVYSKSDMKFKNSAGFVLMLAGIAIIAAVIGNFLASRLIYHVSYRVVNDTDKELLYGVERRQSSQPYRCVDTAESWPTGQTHLTYELIAKDGDGVWGVRIPILEYIFPTRSEYVFPFSSIKFRITDDEQKELYCCYGNPDLLLDQCPSWNL